MNTSAKRVQIRCPECNAVIGSAPENDWPTGDLVCPVCDTIVKGPDQADKLIGEGKHAIKEMIGSADGREKSDTWAEETGASIAHLWCGWLRPLTAGCRGGA